MRGKGADDPPFKSFLSPAAAFDAVSVAIEKILLMPLLLPRLAGLHTLGQSEAPLSSALSILWAKKVEEHHVSIILIIVIVITIIIIVVIIIIIIIILAS